MSEKGKNFYQVFFLAVTTPTFAAVKKTISILFIFIFMVKAFPVMHWVYGSENSIIAVELIDDMDNGEKDNTEKEPGKDLKEKNILQKQFYNKHFAFKLTRLALLLSENAIILHHADINTPPPDIKA